jgi:AAA domain
MSKLKAKAPELTNPGHIKAVLFGKSGSGKTWLALNFPSVYYIDSESGARLPHYTEKLSQSGGAYLSVHDGANDLNTIIEQVQLLATEKHQYKTLVIDSITKPFMTAIANEQERLGDRDAFGASKKPAVAQMRRLINWLSRLDLNVFLIAHEVSEWGLVNGQRTEIGKVADIYDKVIYETDLVLQVRAHSAKRRDAVVYKSRLLGFPTNDVILLQDGEDRGYEAIADRFGRDFIEAEGKTIELATPEQAAQIKKLFEALNLTEDQIGKGLAKRSVETVAELSTKDAATIITELKAKTEV